MREIKFRAWDKEEKKMLYHKLFETWWYTQDNKASIPVKSQSEMKSRLYPMQYTGTKDSEGKEIYEGDVLYWDNRFPQIELVEFGSFGGSWCECGGGIGFNVNEDYTKDCIVKGNIHETPELVPK